MCLKKKKSNKKLIFRCFISSTSLHNHLVQWVALLLYKMSVPSLILRSLWSFSFKKMLEVLRCERVRVHRVL